MKNPSFKGRYNFLVCCERGVTLLEVLLASAVFSLVFTAVLTFYSGGMLNWSRGLAAVDLQQNARIALYEITQELRYATEIEGFNDENTLPLYCGEEQQGQGRSKLSYTAIDGKRCEISYNGTNKIIAMKRASGPRNEIAYHVAGLEFFRYLPEVPEFENITEETEILSMILVVLSMQENVNEQGRGNPYVLQSKIRLLNFPRQNGE